MALNLLFDRKSPGKIDVLELDATVSDGHEYANELTSYPVEDGADITDHIRRHPERVTIEGFITNSPVKYFGGEGKVGNQYLGDQSGTNDESRVASALEKLLELAGYDPAGKLNPAAAGNRAAKIVTVVTGLRNYSNMIMTKLSVPRNSQTGESLRFTAEFVRIIQVKTEVVVVQNTSELNGRAPRVTNQAFNKVDKSKQVAGNTSATQADNTSILMKLIKGASRL